MMMTIDLIHALPVSDRRVISKKEAASYAGVSPGHFEKLVRSGQLPPALSLPGVKRWDKAALDKALDEMSGLSRVTENPYDAWSRSRG